MGEDDFLKVKPETDYGDELIISETPKLIIQYSAEADSNFTQIIPTRRYEMLYIATEANLVNNTSSDFIMLIKDFINSIRVRL